MDIIDRIYQVLFYSSVTVSVLSGAFAVYNWFHPMANSNPYGGIIAGIFELGAIVVFIVAVLASIVLYRLMP